MEQVIDSFSGPYEMFSNFYPAYVYLDGVEFPTIEHAFQAGKSTEHFFRKIISSLPANKAGLAKKRGRAIKLREDWDKVKISLMHDLLCQKFKEEPFKSKLLNTRAFTLIEGNYWHDNIWGNCTCRKCKDIQGQNWLGRLLMEVRSELIEKGDCYRRYS